MQRGRQRNSGYLMVPDLAREPDEQRLHAAKERLDESPRAATAGSQ